MWGWGVGVGCGGGVWGWGLRDVCSCIDHSRYKMTLNELFLLMGLPYVASSCVLIGR